MVLFDIVDDMLWRPSAVDLECKLSVGFHLRISLDASVLVRVCVRARVFAWISVCIACTSLFFGDGGARKRVNQRQAVRQTESFVWCYRLVLPSLLYGQVRAARRTESYFSCLRPLHQHYALQAESVRRRPMR